MIAEIVHAFRVIFGLIFLFFVPGYAIMLALFPRKDELSPIERLGFAGALSIIADILTVLFIDLVLHIPTTPLNIFLSLLTLTVLALLVWRIELHFIRKSEEVQRSDENK